MKVCGGAQNPALFMRHSSYVFISTWEYFGSRSNGAWKESQGVWGKRCQGKLSEDQLLPSAVMWKIHFTRRRLPRISALWQDVVWVGRREFKGCDPILRPHCEKVNEMRDQGTWSSSPSFLVGHTCSKCIRYNNIGRTALWKWQRWVSELDANKFRLSCNDIAEICVTCWKKSDWFGKRSDLEVRINVFFHQLEQNVVQCCQEVWLPSGFSTKNQWNKNINQIQTNKEDRERACLAFLLFLATSTTSSMIDQLCSALSLVLNGF